MTHLHKGMANRSPKAEAHGVKPAPGSVNNMPIRSGPPGVGKKNGPRSA